MNFGKLNKRIVLKKVKSSTVTTTGGTTIVYETAKETWGSLSPLSQREILLYGLALGQRYYRAMIRFDETYNIDQTYTVEWTDRYSVTRSFRVISVLNTNEDAHTIEMLINERTD